MRSTTCAMAAWMAAVLGLASPARAGESAEAYVRRMAEAGTPEKAESQAMAVLDVDLAEPVSTAVLAAIRARSGDAEGAISGVATAAMYGSDEPFVRRTAGQILAWHDTRAGTMAEDVETALETMRRAVADTPEFDEAYRLAFDAYEAAHGAAAGEVRAGATLIADSVEADFAGDADTDAVIFTSAVATCGAGWNCVSPSCRFAWCPELVRDCGVRASGDVRRETRFLTRRPSGAGYGAVRGAWSTPLGTFSGSFTRSTRSVPAASCAPAPVCEPERGGHRR